MSENISSLLLVLFFEMILGFGFMNEEIAARGRIEKERRIYDVCQERIDFNQSLYREITTPSNVQRFFDEAQVEHNYLEGRYSL
jgi:hypothetical protein